MLKFLLFVTISYTLFLTSAAACGCGCNGGSSSDDDVSSYSQSNSNSGFQLSAFSSSLDAENEPFIVRPKELTKPQPVQPQVVAPIAYQPVAPAQPCSCIRRSNAIVKPVAPLFYQQQQQPRVLPCQQIIPQQPAQQLPTYSSQPIIEPLSTLQNDDRSCDSSVRYFPIQDKFPRTCKIGRGYTSLLQKKLIKQINNLQTQLQIQTHQMQQGIGRPCM